MPTQSNNAWNIVYDILIIIFIFIVIIAVYCHNIILSKVAQSHLMPNAMDAIPYTRNKFSIHSNQILNNIGFDVTAKMWSEELMFPLEENMNMMCSSTLGSLYDFINNKNANYTKFYIGNTLQNMFVINFIIITYIYNLVNQYLPDFVALAFSIIIFVLVFKICCICNFFVLTFLWIYNLTIFFYDVKHSDTIPNEVEWIPQPVTFLSLLLLCFDPLTFIEMWIIIVALFLIGWPLVIPCLSVLVTLYCIIFPHYIICKKGSDDTNFTIWNLIKQTFDYRQGLILLMICFFVWVKIYGYFGLLPSAYWVIAIMILYFFFEIFENKAIESTDKLIEGYGNVMQSTKIVLEDRFESVVEEVGTLQHLKDDNFTVPQGFNKMDTISFLLEPSAPPESVANPSTENKDTAAKDPDATDLDSKDPDNKDPDNKDPDNKDPDNKDADNKDTDATDLDAKDADNKDADSSVATSEGTKDADAQQQDDVNSSKHTETKDQHATEKKEPPVAQTPNSTKEVNNATEKKEPVEVAKTVDIKKPEQAESKNTTSSSQHESI